MCFTHAALRRRQAHARTTQRAEGVRPPRPTRKHGASAPLRTLRSFADEDWSSRRTPGPIPRDLSIIRGGETIRTTTAAEYGSRLKAGTTGATPPRSGAGPAAG